MLKSQLYSNIIRGEGIPMNQDIKPEQGEYSVLKIYPNGHSMAVKKVFRQFTQKSFPPVQEKRRMKEVKT